MKYHNNKDLLKISYILISAVFLVVMIISCSNKAVPDYTNQLQEEFDLANPHFSGKILFGYQQHCELPCWDYFLDGIPVSYDFSSFPDIGSEVTIWGKLDKMICENEEIEYIYADSVILDRREIQQVSLSGKIIFDRFSNNGCSPLRLETDCYTLSYGRKADLVRGVDGHKEFPLADLIGYNITFEGEYWSPSCENIFAVTSVSAHERQFTGIGQIFFCDGSVSSNCGKYIFLPKDPGINFLRYYSLETDMSLDRFATIADTVKIWGRTLYPKPFRSDLPVITIDSIRTEFMR